MKTKLIISLLAAVLLTACSPAVVEPSLNCDGAHCVITVTNSEKDDVNVTVSLLQEVEGMPILEELKYSGPTDTGWHDYWYYGFETLFHTTDVLAPGETGTYKVETTGSPGTILFKLVVNTPPPNGFSTAEGEFVRYQVVEFSTVESAIENTLVCSTQTVTAKTTLVTNVGLKTMAVYLNENLDDPYATFIVPYHGETEVTFPIPQGTHLVELDVLGHHNQWDAIQDPHKFRAYCIP